MKKLLLTLGSTAAVVAPVATVVACDDESSVLITTVSGDKLSIIGFKTPKVDLNDEDGYAEYKEFMEEIGSAIRELSKEDKDDIQRIALDGYAYELADDGTYTEMKIDGIVDIDTEFTTLTSNNLSQLIDELPGKTGFTSEASVFGAVITLIVEKTI